MLSSKKISSFLMKFRQKKIGIERMLFILKKWIKKLGAYSQNLIFFVTL
jgi:hypothetical protein